MNRSLIAILSIFLLTACQQTTYHKEEKPDNNSKAIADSASSIDTTAPNVAFLKKQLFDFFEKHKTESVFDTADYTYSAYWGPIYFPPFQVEGGHLFSQDAIHAHIFFATDSSNSLVIYCKQDTGWMKILEDTTINVSDNGSYPQFDKDWNHDGINDLYLFHKAHVGDLTIIDRDDVWLMDKSMKKLHAIPEFPNIENPELDTVTGIITGSMYYHGEKTTQYKFKGYKLVKLSEKWDRDEGY